MKNIDIIIPSFFAKDLVSLAIRSFEKYRNDFNFKYIVVENSSNNSLKEHILSLSSDVIWVHNPVPSFLDTRNPTVRSEANASGLESGLKHVTTDYVFMCHCDVVACHDSWMSFLVSKIKEGYNMAAVREHDECAHVVGLLVETKIARSVSLYPKLGVLDVGDSLTHYCNDNNLKYYICRNTNNHPSLTEEIKKDKYKKMIGIDRTFNDNGDVIYLHLGRGTDKQFNNYHKPNKIYFDDWVKIINEEIL
jgi:molybdopterin-guanine dinucleotide biosynthesis protein A